MFDDVRGIHFLVREFDASVPDTHISEIMYLDGIIVTTCRDLTNAIDSSMTYTQSTRMLAYSYRLSSPAQIIKTHCSVQRCGGEEMGRARVQTYASDLLLRELPEMCCVCWIFSRVGSSDVAI